MDRSIENLTFGVEFEVICPPHLPRAAAAAELSRRIGKPVDSHYGPTGRNWKVVHDGSVHGEGNGLEFVSPHLPPLQGEAGLAEVAAVARALTEMGAAVNTTCGFHVHVGVRGERLDFFKSLVKLYGRFEDAIDSIMPRSRRANGASYCRSIKLVSEESINTSANLNELASKIARASNAAGARYHKVNVTAFSKHSTVEFRQHSGTVDAVKATNWIVTCLKLVAAAKAGKLDKVGAKIATATSNALKTRGIIVMAGRPGGATAEEIAERFGFKVVDVKRHASWMRNKGIGSITQRGYRYFVEVRATTEPTSVPPTLEGLATILDADADHKAWLLARRAALNPIS